MTGYRGRRAFRRPVWQRVLSIFAAVILLAAAYFTQHARGWDLLSGLATALSLLGVLGVLETYTERVTLEEDALHIVRLMGQRRYRRTDISSAVAARGVLPAVRLDNGRVVKLPDVGREVAIAIRVWLRSST